MTRTGHKFMTIDKEKLKRSYSLLAIEFKGWRSAIFLTGDRDFSSKALGSFKTLVTIARIYTKML